MSLSISVSSPAPIPAVTTPDLSKETAALAKLLQTYSRDVQQGQSPAQLGALAKSIATAAKAAGQTVRLPTANAAPAAPAPAAPPVATASGALNKTA